MVLLRDRPSSGEAELFLVKRHGKSAFMANAYVYPGGALDAADSAPGLLARCVGLGAEEAAARLRAPEPRLDDDAPLTEAEALGMHVAAAREVFEEAGVLLARDGSGAWVSFASGGAQARFEAHREALNRGERGLLEILEAEDLRLDLGAMGYFAHWITPVVERRRFNARFFAVLAPPGQEPLHDDREVVDSRWLTPGEALAQYRAGEVQLAPPTLRTLEDMQAAGARAQAIVAGLTARRPVPTLPRFEQRDGALTLLLPGDPSYPSPHPVHGPTRVVMEQGRWWSR